MKRFSPYIKYSMNGEIRYSSTGPDGRKEDSANLNKERIAKIRSMFLPRYELKARQKEVMLSILSGRDTFVVLPTGSGKSLCFQAPSVFFPGITLVITPLTALIENQVNNFNNAHYPRYHPVQKNRREVNYYENIRFKAIYPGMDGLTSQAMFSEIQNPSREKDGKREVQYKLLYVSPERLRDQKFLRALGDAEQNGLRIPHVVIDEAHCMSQWGFDFRESYLYIAGFIRQRPVRPIISAFTATATPKDREEIKNLLRFPTKKEEYTAKKYNELFHMKKRSNLLLYVERCSDCDGTDDAGGTDTGSVPLKTRKDRLTEILLENRTKVCIIYRTTVAGVNELYDALKSNELLKDRLVKYHARMPAKEKGDSKRAFLNSYEEETDPGGSSSVLSKPCKNILIATKAFGMGIDKKDISLVIHYDIPRSPEDYYQEVGRAGRDAEKAPGAMCYLLYSEGPQREKGTMQYTIEWVLSEKDSSDLCCQPITSQFSDRMRENIYFWSYYRLCYMKRYCEYALLYPDAAQNFILRYLENQFTMGQIRRELDSFYRYVAGHYRIPAPERERFLKTHLFTGADGERFLGPCFGQEKGQEDAYHKELRRLLGEVNELHINNTYIANLLRDHPDRYRLNEPWRSGDDPDPEADREAGSEELSFTVHGSEKLTYFDMCVLDAIYSIEISQEKTIYVQTVWQILTGRNSRYSSQEKSTFRARIRSSIDKMRAMSLSVRDPQCGFVIEGQSFLPLTDKPQGQKGYSCFAIPPLCRYAQEKNGQIIKVPVSLFNVEKIERQTLWKTDFQAAWKHDEKAEQTWDDGGRHAFDYHVKYLFQDIRYEEKLKEFLDDRDYRRLERIRRHPYAFSPSLENALLCHYLVRRIAISKKRKRGNFIRFSTIREITGVRDEACLFHKKVAAIMDHYERIGYFHKYYLYIAGYLYEETGGRTATGPAYFRAEARAVIQYWYLTGRNRLQLSDFLVTWSAEPQKERDDGVEDRGLSAAARRKLSLVSPERTDGVVLQHEQGGEL